MNIFDMAMMNKVIAAAGTLSSRASPVNLLAGLTPVASGWDTAPTNLAACTDGDPTTATGTGSTVKAAIDNYGYLTFDLGAVKTFLINAKIAMWSTANSCAVYSYYKEASADLYKTGPTNLTLTTTIEPLANNALTTNLNYPQVLTARYFQLGFKTGAAASATYNAKIYNIGAHELKLAATG